MFCNSHQQILYSQTEQKQQTKTLPFMENIIAKIFLKKRKQGQQPKNKQAQIRNN